MNQTGPPRPSRYVRTMLGYVHVDPGAGLLNPPTTSLRVHTYITNHGTQIDAGILLLVRQIGNGYNSKLLPNNRVVISSLCRRLCVKDAI